MAYAPPVLDFKLPQSEITICQGSTERIGVEPMSGYSYLWTPNSQLSAEDVANPEFNYPTAIVAPEQLSYSVAITRPGNCNVTKQIDITVNPLPHISNALLLGSICSGGVAYSEITTLTPGDVTFNWFRPTVIGINSNAAGIGTGALLLDVLTNSSNSVKTVKYIYTSTANGCSGKDTLQIDIFGQASMGNLTTPAAICDGGTLTLTTPNIQTGGSTILSQGWLLDGSSFSPSTILYTNDNGKYLRYTLSTNCGDYNSNSVVVTVHPYPQISSLKTFTQCSNERFNYTLTSVVNGVGFTWEVFSIKNYELKITKWAVTSKVLTQNAIPQHFLPVASIPQFTIFNSQLITDFTNTAQKKSHEQPHLLPLHPKAHNQQTGT
jgi:hypothetical protein